MLGNLVITEMVSAQEGFRHMEYRDKVLTLAKASPVLPTQVAKALSTDSMLAGAMLSEMVEKGMLKTSSLKVGGSPLYFPPGNESHLLNFKENLSEKDRRTVALLETEKILRESDLEPLTRVSLRQIKDFAVPLTVSYEGKQETFWKWFLLGDKEAEDFIGRKLSPAKAPEKQEEAKVQETRKVEERKIEKPVQQKLEAPEAVKPISASGDFWNRVQSFLASNNIRLVETSVVKKKTEFDLLIELSSPVGPLIYYCKARSKKRLSDADLSSAYVQGQIRKLPVILLTDGELSKQAKEIQDQLKGLAVKKV